MNCGTLRHRVRDLMGDWGIDTFQWSDVICNQALDWAVHTTGEELDCLRKDVSATCTNGNAPIPFSTMDINRVEGIMGILVRSTQQVLDQTDPLWRTRVGVPYAWTYETGASIRLNRIWSGTLTIGVLEHPIPLTADNDPIDTRIPENLQDTLKWAAAAYLVALAGTESDLKKAEIFLQEFYRQLGKPYRPLGQVVR